jgi:hypothetical protein
MLNNSNDHPEKLVIVIQSNPEQEFIFEVNSGLLKEFHWSRTSYGSGASYKRKFDKAAFHSHLPYYFA